MTPLWRKLTNFALLQLCWFGCVLGSAAGSVWIGPATAAFALAMHFAFVAHDRAAEARLCLAVGAMGVVLETLVRAAGVSEPNADIVPAPWSPLWLVGLWLVFSNAVPHSLAWLRGRYALAALMGATAGAVTYQSAGSLGGVHLHPDPLISWGGLALTWAFAMPAMLWLDARIVPPAPEDTRAATAAAA